jgi:hypothetical protein
MVDPGLQSGDDLISGLLALCGVILDKDPTTK